MGGVIAKMVFKNGKETVSSNYNSLWEIPATTIDGSKLDSLASIVSGKNAVLVVNVASKWGLTDKNYRQMVAMHGELADQGFEILTFPCNQFGS